MQLNNVNIITSIHQYLRFSDDLIGVRIELIHINALNISSEIRRRFLSNSFYPNILQYFQGKKPVLELFFR